MKTNELMIGDWVWYDNQPHQIRQLGIFGENRDGDDYPAVCVGKPNGVGLILERNEIEPIPITPEILKKNGFEKDKYGQMVLDEELGTSEIYIVLQDGDECYWWVVNNELIAKIRYIHQLQHALRLCGIEKNIEL